MGLSNIALFLQFQNYNIKGASTATNFAPGPATLLTACSKLVDNLQQAVCANTTCSQLVGKLATRFLHVYETRI